MVTELLANGLTVITTASTWVVIAGVTLVVIGWMYQVTADAVKTWDAVAGTMQTVSYTEASRSATVSPDIEYQYTYAGETYTNEAVYPPGDALSSFDTPADFEAALGATYDAGDDITVYVDPDNPTRSYLTIPDDFDDIDTLTTKRDWYSKSGRLAMLTGLPGAGYYLYAGYNTPLLPVLGVLFVAAVLYLDLTNTTIFPLTSQS